MTSIVYSAAALEDIERLVDFLLEQSPEWAVATFDIIDHGISLLALHPNIGRPIPGTDLKELVISRGRSGYIALYEFDPLTDQVLILAIRHQRELE
ncbi:type II toxin-antitoxin system RelE/ParE family toxin [Methylobacillus pratensis]